MAEEGKAWKRDSLTNYTWGYDGSGGSLPERACLSNGSLGKVLKTTDFLRKHFCLLARLFSPSIP